LAASFAQSVVPPSALDAGWLLPPRAPAPQRSLARLAQFVIPAGRGGAAGEDDEGAADAGDGNVVKILPGNGNRVYCVGWVPTPHKLIGIVGGRYGHLGLLFPDERGEPAPRVRAAAAGAAAAAAAASASMRQSSPKRARRAAGEGAAADEDERREDEAEAKAGAGAGAKDEDEEDDEVEELRSHWATFKLHGANQVLAFACPAQRPSVVLTASLDGHVRVLELERGRSTLLLEHAALPSCLALEEASASGLGAWVGDRDGGALFLDSRCRAAPVAEFAASRNKLRSISLQPNGGHLLLTASSGQTKGDGSFILLWDVRKLPRHGAEAGAGAGRAPAAVGALNAPSSVTSAAWSPDGAWVGSCCTDDKLRFYERPGSFVAAGSGAGPSKSVQHDTQTGRWLTQLRATFDPRAPATLLVGNMTRAIDAFEPSVRDGGISIARARLVESERLTAVPTQVAAHPYLDAVIGGTASGRVLVWRG